MTKAATTTRPMRRVVHIVITAALTVGTLVGTAGPASARERIWLSGTGVAGEVIFDDGWSKAGLQGWVKDTAADGRCAEVWMDFTTWPHQHHDAYVVRSCGSGHAGWGRYNKVDDWRIRGVRTAACTYWPPAGTRNCGSATWPHASADAGTYNLQTV